jgi:hypothetical protein
MCLAKGSGLMNLRNFLKRIFFPISRGETLISRRSRGKSPKTTTSSPTPTPDWGPQEDSGPSRERNNQVSIWMYLSLMIILAGMGSLISANRLLQATAKFSPSHHFSKKLCGPLASSQREGSLKSVEIKTIVNSSSIQPHSETKGKYSKRTIKKFLGGIRGSWNAKKVRWQPFSPLYGMEN